MASLEISKQSAVRRWNGHLHGSKTLINNFLNLTVTLFRRLMVDFKSVAGNRNFRCLFMGVLMVFIMVGVTATLDIYMITYFWELDDAIVLPVLVAYSVGNALGTFASVKLFAIFGKKNCLLAGGLAWAVFQVLPVILRLLDWFPENNSVIAFLSIEMNYVMVLLVLVKPMYPFTKLYKMFYEEVLPTTNLSLLIQP